MIKKISEGLLKISSTWLMIISLLVMVGFMIFVLPAQAADAVSESGSESSPDTSLFYTPDELYRMAEEYGENGRRAYIRARWTFDLVFPLVYTAFLTFGISWFVQRLSGWKEAWKLTNLLPLLGGIFDLLENSATSIAMAAYPSRPDWILVSASVFTPIKWVLVSVSFIPYFIFLVAWLIQKIQGKKS
jgi:hypothetical protein